MAEGTRFTLTGTGRYLPTRTLDASELGAMAGLAPHVVAQRFGVERRHYAQGAETSSAMATHAARAALAEAGIAADKLDVIVGACAVMEQPIPGTSVLVHHALGLCESGIPAFDVNATCLSFLLALDHVMAGFATGRWRRALIVSADIASAALDYADPEASLLFGDGAAAVVLEAGGPHEWLAYDLRTYSAAYQACRLEAGGTRLRPDADMAAFLAGAKFRMDGPAVFRATARPFPGFLGGLFARAGARPEDIASIIPHQASRPALEHLKRCIPGGAARTVDIFAEVGNCIAASLPLALHQARGEGRLEAGSHSLLIGSAAGVSLGGAVIRW